MEVTGLVGAVLIKVENKESENSMIMTFEKDGATFEVYLGGGSMDGYSSFDVDVQKVEEDSTIKE